MSVSSSKRLLLKFCIFPSPPSLCDSYSEHYIDNEAFYANHRQDVFLIRQILYNTTKMLSNLNKNVLSSLHRMAFFWNFWYFQSTCQVVGMASCSFHYTLADWQIYLAVYSDLVAPRNRSIQSAGCRPVSTRGWFSSTEELINSIGWMSSCFHQR